LPLGHISNKYHFEEVMSKDMGRGNKVIRTIGNKKSKQNEKELDILHAKI
jgi:hypothetical protein